MDDATTKVELDYAPRTPVLRRRWVRLLLILLAVAIALGITWWKSKTLRSRLPYVYSDWQYMRFSAPPDLVAYEEDEKLAAALATRADYQLIQWCAPAATRPALQPVGFLPPVLGQRRGAKAPAVFIGGLTPANGREMIVTVEIVVDGINNRDRNLHLDPSVLTPVPLLGPLPHTSLPPVRNHQSVVFNLARTYRLRLYWGRRDPQHPDRFTIRYVINEIPGLIEGRIDNDGKIKFTVLEGPLGNRMH